MAISAADMNQARVDILGTTVDNPGATWTLAPPGAANRLTTAERVVTRAINALNTNAGGVLDSVTSFVNRFGRVVGEEATVDQAAFDAIGMNLIQAVAAIMAGGGISPVLSLAFEFPNPLGTGDHVEIVATQDCTIPIDLAGTEYTGDPEPNSMFFELTVQPAGTVIGEVEVHPGGVVNLGGTGAAITAGTALRMSAVDIINGPRSPGAVIRVEATRQVTPPVSAGGKEFPQTAADTTWTLAHNFDQRIVLIQAVDGAGNTIIGDPHFVDNNVATLTFSRAVSGTAVVRR